jgi:hypothetical protein
MRAGRSSRPDLQGPNKVLSTVAEHKEGLGTRAEAKQSEYKVEGRNSKENSSNMETRRREQDRKQAGVKSPDEIWKQRGESRKQRLN